MKKISLILVFCIFMCGCGKASMLSSGDVKSSSVESEMTTSKSSVEESSAEEPESEPEIVTPSLTEEEFANIITAHGFQMEEWEDNPYTDEEQSKLLLLSISDDGIEEFDYIAFGDNGKYYSDYYPTTGSKFSVVYYPFDSKSEAANFFMNFLKSCDRSTYVDSYKNGYGKILLACDSDGNATCAYRSYDEVPFMATNGRNIAYIMCEEGPVNFEDINTDEAIAACCELVGLPGIPEYVTAKHNGQHLTVLISEMPAGTLTLDRYSKPFSNDISSYPRRVRLDNIDVLTAEGLSEKVQKLIEPYLDYCFNNYYKTDENYTAEYVEGTYNRDHIVLEDFAYRFQVEYDKETFTIHINELNLNLEIKYDPDANKITIDGDDIFCYF